MQFLELSRIFFFLIFGLKWLHIDMFTNNLVLTLLWRVRGTSFVSIKLLPMF